MTESGLLNIKQALYIKLGEGGAWERLCLQDGTIRVGFYDVSPDLVFTRHVEGIRQVYLSLGKTDGTATRFAGELLKFYEAGTETLWITFSGGMLYWAVTEDPPEYLGADKAIYPHGSTLRRTISGWQNVSLSGTPSHRVNMMIRLIAQASF